MAEVFMVNTKAKCQLPGMKVSRLGVGLAEGVDLG